jgi:fructan beta-fructosidase
MKYFIYLLSLSFIVTSCSKTSRTNPELYRETHRPQFHFSPEKGWMNDPNGLVYYDGIYHLFYQHYPDSNVWGPMHWGHATSHDLVHWQQQPIALYPDSLGYIFSGSAVIDDNNTAGFQKGKEKTLVAIFTYHDMVKEKAGRTDRESQGIAYSNDKGNTWIKYAGNPVLKNKGDKDFRDPKVFWFEATKKWIMPLASGDHLEIFSSPNLKEWTKESDFGKKEGSHGGVWECPDLFPLKTEDGMEKWVLIQNIDRGAIGGGSGTQYFIGRFDGKTFINDNNSSTTLWFDYGADNYAGVTWFGAPDNRRIFIGWMSNWDDYAILVPTKGWRSALTIPREIWLVNTPDGIRISQHPVDELKKLRGEKLSIGQKTFGDSLVVSENNIQKELELAFDLSKSTSTSLGFIISNSRNEKVAIGYDKTKNEFFIDRTASGKTGFSRKFPRRHAAPYKANGVLKIHAFIDNSSVEVFVDDGEVVMTELFFPNEDFARLTLFSNGGNAELLKTDIYKLQRIFGPPISNNLVSSLFYEKCHPSSLLFWRNTLGHSSIRKNAGGCTDERRHTPQKPRHGGSLHHEGWE